MQFETNKSNNSTKNRNNNAGNHLVAISSRKDINSARHNFRKMAFQWFIWNRLIPFTWNYTSYIEEFTLNSFKCFNIFEYDSKYRILIKAFLMGIIIKFSLNLLLIGTIIFLFTDYQSNDKNSEQKLCIFYAFFMHFFQFF